MVIDERVEQVKQLLERIRSYKNLILADSFGASTISDMKGNAKDLCNAAKAEIDNIKAEINNW